MRYAPGDIIEEGARKGEKPDDVFEAVETVPEIDKCLQILRMIVSRIRVWRKLCLLMLMIYILILVN